LFWLPFAVVAEGVEDEATLERARDLGCDLLQGYHLGRPMDAAGIAARMAT
jgi:EAL domain-containing protein (putative c-di-GMP-specific phosphodiesterase class I)